MSARLAVPWPVLVLFLVAALATTAGCASLAQAPDQPPTALPTLAPTALPVAYAPVDALPTPTPNAVPSPIPATATVLPVSPTPKPGPFPGLTTWDLLIISDSSNWGVADHYAEFIKADQHVEVTVHDCWIGGMSVRTALDLLRQDAPAGQGTYLRTASCEGKWTDLVREAEVIVVHGNPSESKPADGSWDGPDSPFVCVLGSFADKSADPSALAAYRASITRSCAPETFATYKADLGSLFDEIFSLRDGRPVILRATDFYIAPIAFSTWPRAGLMESCAGCSDNFAAAIHQTAADHGVPVASSMDALNGTDHRSDPSALGYIGADNEHLSNEGAQRVAEALRQTGYGYAGK